MRWNRNVVSLVSVQVVNGDALAMHSGVGCMVMLGHAVYQLCP